jgi:hypothetical protein
VSYLHDDPEEELILILTFVDKGLADSISQQTSRSPQNSSTDNLSVREPLAAPLQAHATYPEKYLKGGSHTYLTSHCISG